MVYTILELDQRAQLKKFQKKNLYNFDPINQVLVPILQIHFYFQIFGISMHFF